MQRNERLKRIATGTVLAALALLVADAVFGPTASSPPSASSEPPVSDDEQLNPVDTGPNPDLPPGKPPANEPAAGPTGVPEIALRAYRTSEQRTAQSRPTCHLPWSLVAAIGRVESNHARGGQVDGAGTTLNPIFGPQLSGNGYAKIEDTDNGVLDGDKMWDRAVGPMQFIPAAWVRNGTDANTDGVASPHNLFDAAAATGRYLCGPGRDMRDPADRAGAVFSYNPSQSYVNMVLAWERAYANGATTVPGSPSPDVVAAPPPGAPPLGSPAPNQPAPGPVRPPATGTNPTLPPPAPGDPDPNGPPSEECLLSLEKLGVAPEDLLDIKTELACQEHVLRIGPLQLDELPLLPGLGGR